MFSLPVETLREIEDALSRVPLDDLVLVLPQGTKDALLFVYNRADTPKLLRSTWSAKRLDDLTEEDCLNYRTPAVGFAALDVIFPISTYGEQFVPFTNLRMFKQHDKERVLKTSAYHLAKWLYQKRSEKEKRISRKAIELALPAILQESLATAVAVNVSLSMTDVLPGEKDIQIFTVKDIALWQEIVFDEQVCVFALEEMQYLRPEFLEQFPRFVELRNILRLNGMTSQLSKTLLDLAQIFWNEWERSEDKRYQSIAYQLTAESLLMKEDVEDLIAILPHRNFRRFRTFGDAIRIYLTPRIGKSERSTDYSLGDLLNRRIPDEILEMYSSTPPIAFPVLDYLSHLLDYLRQWNKYTLIDLSLILYKAGHAAELARTLYLLSHDLRRYPELRATLLSSEKITDLALRATLILSLSDPWDKRWRFRYLQTLRRFYQHLETCWKTQKQRETDDALKLYIQALQFWYSSFQSRDLLKSLNKILIDARAFLESTSQRGDLEKERETIRRLYDISAFILGQDMGENKFIGNSNSGLEPTGVERYLRQISDFHQSVPIISSQFNKLLASYSQLHSQWLILRDEGYREDTSAKQFLQLFSQFKSLQQQSLAPAHERDIVRWACKQDMEQIRRLQIALTTGTDLRLRVLNPHVVLGKVEHVYVEVENMGNAVAHDVHIALSASSGFDLATGEGNVRTIKQLQAHHKIRVEWMLKAREAPLKLSFILRYREKSSAEIERQYRISITALSTENTMLPLVGGNPFTAGPPVFGDNFFGREKEIREILMLLLSGVTQPILIRGPRRMGKSSILFQIRYLLGGIDGREEQSRGEIVRLGFSPESELALRQIHPIVVSLQEIPDENYIGRWFQAVLEHICRVGNIPCDTKTLKEDFDTSLPHFVFKRHFERLLQQYPEMRPLIMIDEWDEQQHYKNLATNLRALMQEEQRVNWIISSTWTLQEEAGRYGSPFYSQSRIIELKAMTWSSAERMLYALSKRSGIEWQGDAIVSLLDKTARRPYLTQWLAQDVANKILERDARLVNQKILNEVLSNIVKTPQIGGQPFSFLWDERITPRKNQKEPRLGWLGRLILYVLDKHYPKGMDRQRIKEEISRLLNEEGINIEDENFDDEFAEQMTQLEFIFDVIEKTKRGYAFSIPIMRDWFHYTIANHSKPLAHIMEGIVADMAWREEGI